MFISSPAWWISSQSETIRGNGLPLENKSSQEIVKYRFKFEYGFTRVGCLTAIAPPEVQAPRPVSCSFGTDRCQRWMLASG
jgi:hypothetical protein